MSAATTLLRAGAAFPVFCTGIAIAFSPLAAASEVSVFGELQRSALRGAVGTNVSDDALATEDNAATPPPPPPGRETEEDAPPGTKPIPENVRPGTLMLWEAGWKEFHDHPDKGAALRYLGSHGKPVYVQGSHYGLGNEQWFHRGHYHGRVDSQGPTTGWETAGVKYVQKQYYVKKIAHVKKTFNLLVNPGVRLDAQLPKLMDGEHASEFELLGRDNRPAGFEWTRLSGRPVGPRGYGASAEDQQSVFHFNMNPNHFTGKIAEEVSDNWKIVKTKWTVERPDLVDIARAKNVRGGDLMKFQWRNDGAREQLFTSPVSSCNTWTNLVPALPRSELTVEITLAFDLGSDGKGVMLPEACA